MRRSLLVLPGALVALALTLAGCGGGGHGGGDDEQNAKVAPGARVIQVDSRSFEFDPDEIEVDAREDVAIELKSEDTFHDFVVEGAKGVGHVVGTSDKAKGGLRIDKPGEYAFYCSVAGHRAGGMEGTIRVAG